MFYFCITKTLKINEIRNIFIINLIQPTGYTINKCSGNNPSVTNHYIVVVGKSYDSEKNQYYYRFYEVGTSYHTNGTSNMNRLYVDSVNHIVKGNTQYINVTDFYTLTEVRKNIGEDY